MGATAVSHAQRTADFVQRTAYFSAGNFQKRENIENLLRDDRENLGKPGNLKKAHRFGRGVFLGCAAPPSGADEKMPGGGTLWGVWTQVFRRAGDTPRTLLSLVGVGVGGNPPPPFPCFSGKLLLARKPIIKRVTSPGPGPLLNGDGNLAMVPGTARAATANRNPAVNQSADARKLPPHHRGHLEGNSAHAGRVELARGRAALEAHVFNRAAPWVSVQCSQIRTLVDQAVPQ